MYVQEDVPVVEDVKEEDEHDDDESDSESDDKEDGTTGHLLTTMLTSCFWMFLIRYFVMIILHFIIRFLRLVSLNFNIMPSILCCVVFCIGFRLWDLWQVVLYVKKMCVVISSNIKWLS